MNLSKLLYRWALSQEVTYPSINPAWARLTFGVLKLSIVLRQKAFPWVNSSSHTHVYIPDMVYLIRRAIRFIPTSSHPKSLLGVAPCVGPLTTTITPALVRLDHYVECPISLGCFHKCLVESSQANLHILTIHIHHPVRLAYSLHVDRAEIGDVIETVYFRQWALLGLSCTPVLDIRSSQGDSVIGRRSPVLSQRQHLHHQQEDRVCEPCPWTLPLRCMNRPSWWTGQGPTLYGTMCWLL